STGPAPAFGSTRPGAPQGGGRSRPSRLPPGSGSRRGLVPPPLSLSRHIPRATVLLRDCPPPGGATPGGRFRPVDLTMARRVWEDLVAAWKRFLTGGTRKFGTHHPVRAPER